MFNKMRITRGSADGRMPWSPTVVNIQRQRRKRSKRLWWIAGIIVIVLTCAICGVTVKLYKPKSARTTSPTMVPASATPIPASAVPAPTAATRQRWTPMPGNPLMGFRVEPLSTVSVVLTPTRIP